MIEEEGSLRLAAIVFTDIVGYSALVHRSPELGKELLDRQRQVVRKRAPLYRGREIETAGDSFLLEFESAYTALVCVADIQRGLAKANADSPEPEQVQLRCGIHLGDVEHRGAEVFGDGVNVAARILPHSPIGGVAFSDVVNRQVQNRIGVSAQSTGVHALKNIAQPIEIFVLDAEQVRGVELTLTTRGTGAPAAVHPALYTSSSGKTAAGEAAGTSLCWKFANAQFDDRTLELKVDGGVVELERKPLEVLRHLLWHAGEVVTKDELLDAVWPGRVLSETVLKKAISRVRDVLKDESESIVKTVRGYGYRLVAPVAVEHSGATAVRPRMEFKAGDPVGLRPQWLLIERLGTGGNGEAWLAEHVKTRERRAYKFAAEGTGLVSLKREITIYRLLHDTLGERADLVRVLDWNLEQEPYFTEAEYVSGGNLQDWAQRQGGLHNVAPLIRIDLAAQIAETLAAAHSLGVLHKDLKPSNVFIDDRDPAHPVAKLADFGSGTVLNPTRLNELGITVLGLGDGDDTGTGTPLYLPPEIVAGQPATVQGDVYALGAMLYQFVIGDLRKPLAPGWEQDIDDELLREDIAAAAHGNPRMRLADAATLEQRLRSLDQRRIERAAERAAQAKAEQAFAAVERYKARRSGFLLAIATLIVGLAVSLVLYAQAREARRDAERQAAEAEAASAFLMRDVLSGIDPGQRDVKALAGAKELLDAGARKIDQRFAQQPVLAAKVRHRFILAYFSLGFIGDGIALGDIVRAQAQQALTAQTPEALQLGIMLAADAPNIGLRESDETYWLQLKALAVDELEREDPQLLRVRFVLGLLLATRGEYPDARTELEQVVELQRHSEQKDPQFALQAAGALSRVYVDIGELALAESTLRQAIDRASVSMGRGSAAILAQRARLTRILTDRARYADAQREVTDALAIALSTRGPANTLVIELELAQGLLHAEQGHFEEARAIMEPAVARFAAGTPQDDGVLLAFDSGLARVDQWAGRLDSAESRLRLIVEMELKHSSKDSVRVANSQIALADLMRETGRVGEARALIAGLSPLAVERIKANGPTKAELQRIEGLIRVAEGQGAEAIGAVQAALENEQQYFGDNHVWIRKAREQLAQESSTR